MRILRGLEALPDSRRAGGCVVTVGVFDGVHLGHFLVIRKVCDRAAELGVAAAGVTFAEHPKAVLTGRAPATVTSLDHRLLLFSRAGLETVLVLDFTPELRAWRAEEFLQRVLLEGLGTREIVLGFDSKFGRGREGTAGSMKPFATARGIGLTEVPALRLGGRAVSSTAVREAVALGELGRAAVMLGRPVSLLGTVVPGERRGRELGFPTANLDLHHELRPPDGVYGALVLRAGVLLPAVVNIGIRPTFGSGRSLVEVHLLDFEADLYGEELEVYFLGRIRDEQRFENAEALSAAIVADAAQARRLADAAPEHWRIPGEYLPIEGPGPEGLVIPAAARA